MYRLAVISDVHADADALCDALERIAELDCDAAVCAGDLVGWGAEPGRTLTLLVEPGIPCIRGNHDRWALEAAARGDSTSDLVEADLAFLSDLPARWDASFDGVRVAVRHGTPKSDMDGIYPDRVTGSDLRRFLDQVRADVLVVGHTHEAFALPAPSGGLVVNPGALLRTVAPNQTSPMAANLPAGGTFGVLQLPACRFRVCRAADGVEVEIRRR